MKRRVSVYLDHEIVEKAHSLGLNVYRIAENALKQAINRINGAYNKTEQISWCGRRDLNPGHRRGRPMS